jgi:hypothetical protein
MKPLGRSRFRWEDKIKMEARSELIWLRIGAKWWVLVNAVMNFRVPQTAESFVTG